MPEKLTPQREKEIRAEFPNYPFPAYLGLTIEKLEFGYARLKLYKKQELAQGMGLLHGGAIAGLCDTSMAFALATMNKDVNKMLTIEMKVNFIGPADDHLFADARIIHKGRKTAVGEVDVRKSDGALIAKALLTYYLLDD